MSATRVVLVDDHRLFRSGVRSELGESVSVVGEAEDVATAVEAITRTIPDVVLLDVHLPGGGGRAVLDAIRRTLPGVRFLALSVSDAADDVIDVVRGGARGYVTKTISGAELTDAIRRVAEGDAVFSPRLAGFVLDAFSGTPPATAPTAPPTSEMAAGGPSELAADSDMNTLTPRERDVLRLIARGYTYREIGAELYISVKTVETHVSAVLRKLQLSNRHELTRWAVDRQLG